MAYSTGYEGMSLIGLYTTEQAARRAARRSVLWMRCDDPTGDFDRDNPLVLEHVGSIRTIAANNIRRARAKLRVEEVEVEGEPHTSQKPQEGSTGP